MTRFRFAPAALALLAAVASPTLAAEPWQIDGAHSSVTFSVTHLMIATVRGEIGPLSGTVEYDGKDLGSIKVDAAVEVATIDTGIDKRDGHLKTDDFFDAANHPKITFKSKKVTAGTKPGTFQITGDLTIRGTTKEVTFDGTGPSQVIKGPRGETRVAASVTGTIKRLEYGLKWNPALEAGGVVVSDDVKLTIDIAAVQAPPAPPAGAAK